MSQILHVATTGSVTGDGTHDHPFKRINDAAQVAMPGDTVLVHQGEYREWVKPLRGGLSDQRRITYEAAPGETVKIKGSERIQGWVRYSGDVWRVDVPQSLFGDFNPFAEEVSGDWIVYDKDVPRKHLGDVYLNGMSFYEAHSVEDVEAGAVRTESVDHWTGVTEEIRNPSQTAYRWYAEVGEDFTTIWANFHGDDPNEELVEINVRPSVFFPERHHVDFITVRGFDLSQAACPWTPPTADQPGLIGPNWARGWIIEDNVIHDAKCSAVSLGKEVSTGDNYATLRGDKPGYQYQLESVFSARQIGWDREHIGSHIVRRNTIYDCGQNGVVGHLGCVFSTIEDNHIFNIAIKREFYGYEIGGIKLHAAIDVTIEHNLIHDCSLGTWLDWQTQGTRVTRNVYANNRRDLFVEVSHGPYVVDNNVLASPAAIETFSQGGAYLNNLIAGTVRIEAVMDRATPYHRPHSTQVAGYAVIYGGDDRFIGNIFIGGDRDEAYAPTAEREPEFGFGTAVYDRHPASFAEYLDLLSQQPDGDHERFPGVKQAVYLRNNVYLGGAEAYQGETEPLVLEEPGGISVTVDNDRATLVTHLPHEVLTPVVQRITGADLERVRFVDADFEEPDGSPLVVGKDLVGALREQGTRYPAGPLTTGVPTDGSLTIW